MLKTTVKSSEAKLGIGDGYVISNYQIERLVGEILTLIEALGLKDSQEKATKDLIKQKVWGLSRDLPYLTGDLLTAIHTLTENVERLRKEKAVAEMKTQDSNNPLPPGYIKGEYELTFTEVKE